MSDSKAMWPQAIVQERWASRVRCALASSRYRADLLASSRHRPDLTAALEAFGLAGDVEELLDIAPDVAAAVLEALLCQSIMGGASVMPQARAKTLAAQFLATFPQRGTRYFTNAPWHNRPRAMPVAPFTESMMDGGLLAISSRLIGCVWIEEHD